MEISFLELQEHTVTRKVSNYFPCWLLWSSIPLLTSYISFPFLSSLLSPPAFKIASVAPAVSWCGEDAPRTRVRAVNDPHPPSLSILLSSIPFPLSLLSSILSLSLSVSRSTLPGVYIYIYIYIYICVAVGLSTLPFPLLRKQPGWTSPAAWFALPLEKIGGGGGGGYYMISYYIIL